MENCLSQPLAVQAWGLCPSPIQMQQHAQQISHRRSRLRCSYKKCCVLYKASPDSQGRIMHTLRLTGLTGPQMCTTQQSPHITCTRACKTLCLPRQIAGNPVGMQIKKVNLIINICHPSVNQRITQTRHESVMSQAKSRAVRKVAPSALGFTSIASHMPRPEGFR